MCVPLALPWQVDNDSRTSKHNNLLDQIGTILVPTVKLEAVV